MTSTPRVYSPPGNTQLILIGDFEMTVIFLVQESGGSHDDAYETVVFAYAKREDAEAKIINLQFEQARCQDVFEEWRAKYLAQSGKVDFAWYVNNPRPSYDKDVDFSVVEMELL